MDALKKVIFILLASCVSKGYGQSGTAERSINNAIEKQCRKMQLHSGMELGQGISLIDTSGKIVSLLSFKGKTCYVDLWFAGCAPCAYQIPFWKKRYAQFAKDTNVAFITINMPHSKSDSNWREYIKEHEIPGFHFMVASTASKKIGMKAVESKFFTDAYPTYYLIDENGKLIGYDIDPPSNGMITDYILANGKTMPAYRSFLKFYRLFQGTNKREGSPELVKWVEAFYERPFNDVMKEMFSGPQ